MPTLKGVPRSQASMEAERGETVLGDFSQDGSLSHAKIAGKRHSQGGTPLSVPEGSFVFSDTSKMKIKDPALLENFGKKLQKGSKGHTPASLAKQYQLDFYKRELQRADLDPIQRRTYETMLAKNQQKLGELAFLQESMKGFPSGIPDIAQPLVEEKPELGQMAQQQMMAQQMPSEEAELQQYAEGGPIERDTVLYINGQKRKVVKKHKGFFGDDWITFDQPIRLKDRNGKEAYHSEFNLNDFQRALNRGGRLDLYDDAGVAPLFGEINRDFRDVDNGTSDAGMSRPSQGNAYNRLLVTRDAPSKGAKTTVKSRIEPGKEFWVGNRKLKVVQPDVVDTRGGRKVRVKEIQDDDNTIGSWFNTFDDHSLLSEQEVLAALANSGQLSPLPKGQGSSSTHYVEPGLGTFDPSATYPMSETPAVADPVPVRVPRQVPTQVPSEASKKTKPQAVKKTSYTPPSLPRPSGTELDRWDTGGPTPAPVNPYANAQVLEDNPEAQRRVVLVGDQAILVGYDGKELGRKKISGAGNFAQYSDDLNQSIGKVDGKNGFEVKRSKFNFGNFGKQHQREDSGLWTSNENFHMDFADDFKDRHADWIDSAYDGGYAKFVNDVQKKGNTAAGWFQDQYNKRYHDLTGEDYFKPFKKGSGNPYMRDGLFGQVTFSAPGLTRKTTPVSPIKPGGPSITTNPLANVDLGKKFPQAPDMRPPAQKEEPEAIGNPFWAQDMVDIGGAFYDLAKLRRYMPQLQQVPTELPDFVPLDPTRQIAAAGSLYHTAADQNSLTADGAVARANNLAAAGKMGANVADMLSQYENQNAQLANQHEQQRSALVNQGAQQNAALRKRYLDEVTTANQQYDNSKREGMDRLRQRFRNAMTNRMETNWQEIMYSPYRFNRVTGDIYFDKTRARKYGPGSLGSGTESGTGAGTGGLNDVFGMVDQIMTKYRGQIPMDQAFTIATRVHTQNQDLRELDYKSKVKNPALFGLTSPLSQGSLMQSPAFY